MTRRDYTRLTARQIAEIERLYGEGVTYADIAAALGLTRNQVQYRVMLAHAGGRTPKAQQGAKPDRFEVARAAGERRLETVRGTLSAELRLVEAEQKRLAARAGTLRRALDALSTEEPAA